MNSRQDTSLEQTAPSTFRTVGPLVAAALLFVLGLAGVLVAFPYSNDSGFVALLVTNPSGTPEAASATPDASAFVADPIQGISTSIARATAAAIEAETVAVAVVETEEPAVEAAADNGGVATLAPPDPTQPPATPTPEPTERPTNTPQPTPEPTKAPETPTAEPTTATPAETLTPVTEEPDGEHPRSSTDKPATAFFDPNANSGTTGSGSFGAQDPSAAVPPPPVTNP